MANGNGKGIWQALATGVCAILAALAMTWTNAIGESDDDQNDRLNANEENVRTIHHELQVNRDLLKRIDKNTGGDGEAPDVRRLRKPDK